MIKRMVKGLLLGVAGLAGLAVVAAAILYGVSEAMINERYPRPEVRLAAATDAGAVGRGERLARVYGCRDCHGPDLTGRMFHDEPPVVRASGANLTLAAAEQSDEDLARSIRRGIAPDGRGLWVMPSQAFAHFTDAETADLLAYLRSVKPKGERVRTLDVGPVGRLGLVLGKFKPAPAMAPSPALPDHGDRFAQGRNLARACVECHGAQLEGEAMLKSPDLSVAAAYDLADFKRLMRTGIAPGGRRLGLMTAVAPARFDAWTDEEIAALHAYLRARAGAG